MKSWKPSLSVLVVSILILSLLIPLQRVGAAVVVSDNFADGNSQNQDLANNSLRIFNGRSANTRTDAVGSVAFNLASTSSDAFWAFFTNSGSPVTLDVGDKLSVAQTFTLTYTATTGDIRGGLLDSKGTRNTANLTGGQNDATFAGDTGYGVDFFPSGSGSPFVIGRRSTTPSGANNPFNSFGDFPAITSEASGATTRQTLLSGVPYTLTYSVERLTDTRTRVSVSVTGGSLSNLNYSVVETSTSPLTTFDYFTFRIPSNSFASQVKYTQILVNYAPSAPVITTQPQPASLTVGVGSNVQLSVGATGRQLSYQWRKNANPITGDASATTGTLQLTNLQLVDTGAYDVVVTNPGGSTTSDTVALSVSDGPVDPPPIILTQPRDTTVTVGNPASLSVSASGNGLTYQWFKNGSLINGANGATLSFPNAQVADAASYTVVVGNGGGTVSSNPARLTVVSTMAATLFGPVNNSTNVCTDTPFRLTFDQVPRVGNSGKLNIYKSDGTLVDTIDMSLAQQSKIIGGASFNYYPIMVSGNTATIYPHVQLAYNTTYYVTMAPGVITDGAGVPFAGFTDPATFRFSTKPLAPTAGSNVVTVAADGSGDFCTVQGAVDFVPAGNNQRVIIDVRNGTYTGIVLIPSAKPFVTVRGESRDGTVIQYPNNNSFNPASTSARSMFGVDASDFSLENITLYNTTPQGGSQAEALRTNGARAALIRVNLKSFQDTLLTQKSAFVTDSYIEGDVDFMWGNGATFFKNTELKMMREGLGYYTQIRNNASTSGNVYVNCKLTHGPGITNGSYLSRIDPNVFPDSQVVFINTQMDSHIRPVGWLLDNAVAGASYPNVRFWEYNSTDLNGNPVDVSQRLSISRQLTAAEAAQWSDPTYVLGGWTPQEKLTALVSLSSATFTYDGSPKSIAPTTNPGNLNVSVIYNGSPTPPVNAGTYTVVATVNDPNYTGSATATLVINPAGVAITLGNMNHVYDGNPKAATVSTSPAGVPVSVTYDSSSNPPTDPGSYVVEAAVTDSNYVGGATGKLNIFPNRPLAFPGAEGYGAFALGGRGGDVYHVTNLNDSGAGSLREGIRTANGPRTIVFDVSGTIYLQSRLDINKPFLTLAGQTAPGDGITVAGETTVIDSTHDVIVRYMRFRGSDLRCPTYQGDSLWVDKSTDVIVDHVSASWSVDETLSVTESNRVTVQWSLISESLKISCHQTDDGTGLEPHGYGSLLRYGNGSYTFHHNVYAHHANRNPRIGDDLSVDFVNNVVYDWTINAGYSGDASEGTPHINWINNYFIAGHSTPTGSARNRTFQGGSTNTLVYQAGNLLDNNVNGVRDGVDTGWSMITGAYTRQMTPFDFPAVTLDDARTAYTRVLDKAGSSIVRDAVDTRVLSHFADDSGTQINSQNDVGGFPVLNSLPAQLDSDGDGIPNGWELLHGLDPSNGADGRAIAANGYSNLENYLNGIDASPVNHAPAANADAVTTDEDTAVAINVLANDSDDDGDALAISSVGNGSHGTVAVVNGMVRYTPATNFNGTDSFNYSVTDGVATASSTVTVTVNPVNDAPVLNAIPAQTVYLGATLTFNAVASDVDVPETLTYSVTGAVPAGASIDPATGAFTWTPDRSQVGAVYTFNVRVTDSGGLFDEHAVTTGVAYDWSGYLSPLGAEGVSARLGSAVPVKFQLTGASSGITNAVARLTLTAVNGGVVGTEFPATPAGSSNSGNVFRYDALSDQYIFNLSTRDLATGTYQLRIDLGDGVVRTTNLILK